MTVRGEAVWPVNSLNEIVVQAGVGSTTVTGFVPSSQIATDESTNKVVMKLPDLDAIVLAEPLTGFVSGTGTVSATDTILTAFDKIVGNQLADETNIASNTTAIALKAPIDAAALTGLTGTQARKLNVREVVAAGAITMNATDDVILVNKTVGAATTVNLTAGTTGRRVQIKDKKADANTNNITLTANGAETIDGSNTFVMNVNRQASTLIFSGTEWSLI